MDDCRRCGAPLTDNGCEYCGDGRPAEHRYSLDVARQELDRAAAWRYSAFVKGLTKSVEDSDRTAFRWQEVVVYGLVLAALIAFIIGKVRTPSMVAEHDGVISASFGMTTSTLTVSGATTPLEFVTSETAVMHISPNYENITRRRNGIVSVQSNRTSNHFYHRRTSH